MPEAPKQRGLYEQFTEWRKKQAALPKGHPERVPEFHQDEMLPAGTKVQLPPSVDADRIQADILNRVPDKFHARIKELFSKYRPLTRWHLANIMLYAAEPQSRDMLDDVITALEKYHAEEETYAHPDLPPLKLDNFMIFLVNKMGGPKQR